MPGGTTGTRRNSRRKGRQRSSSDKSKRIFTTTKTGAARQRRRNYAGIRERWAEKFMRPRSSPPPVRPAREIQCAFSPPSTTPTVRARIFRSSIRDQLRM